MKKFKISYSDIATDDIYNLTYIIINKYKSPLTSVKYIADLINEIDRLKVCAESIQFCKQKTITDKFGINARRINFKKMAIIYTIFQDIVVIEAILPQTAIKEL
ncbi:MAG: hypothetical protein ACOYOT_05725 [Bacteroidales bacterium]